MKGGGLEASNDDAAAAFAAAVSAKLICPVVNLTLQRPELERTGHPRLASEHSH